MIRTSQLDGQRHARKLLFPHRVRVILDHRRFVGELEVTEGVAVPDLCEGVHHLAMVTLGGGAVYDTYI